jgi:hyperosmotically inducible periplasmic protein
MKWDQLQGLFIVLAIAAATGCERNQRTQSEVAEVNPATRSAAENTNTNKRDRSPSTLTPGDQGGSESDRTITQQVRQGVVGHDNLSMTAENVKIITVDGVVTLRGPVNSEQEQSTIGAIAQSVDGVTRVDNQLEIAGR